MLVDKQLGHALTSKDLDVFKAVRALAGNSIGRKHYLDMDSKLLDPTSCAEAVCTSTFSMARVQFARAACARSSIRASRHG